MKSMKLWNCANCVGSFISLFIWSIFQWCWIMNRDDATELFICRSRLHLSAQRLWEMNLFVFLSHSLDDKKKTRAVVLKILQIFIHVGLYGALLTLLWCLTHSPSLSLSPSLPPSISVPSRNHLYLREGRSSHHIHLGPQWAPQHPSRPAGRGLQLSAEGRHLGAGGKHPWAGRLSSAAHSKERWEITTSFTLHSRTGDRSVRIVFLIF